jgi:hypothetical protein
MQRLPLYLLLAVLLSACGALQPEDEVATMAVDSANYQTEAVNLAVTGDFERISNQSTIAVNQTNIAVMNAINQNLLATLSTRVTPTPPLVGESSPDDTGLLPNMPNMPSGGSAVPLNIPYIATGLSTSVREDDGCVTNPRSAFSADELRIYATFVAYNLTQGTALSAAWYREEDQVASGAWTADADYEKLCIWFYIQQPDDVAFTPGGWSVRLYADNEQIGNTLPFTFEALPIDAMTG